MLARRFSGLAAKASVLAGLFWLLRPARGEGEAPGSPRERKLHGLEIFPGVGTPLSCATRYGATFAAVGRGPVSSLLVGYVNYTPIFFEPGTECAVVGGRWLLVEGERLLCRRVLVGSFTGGTVRWNGDAKLAAASIDLRISGGPRARHESSGHLAAALNHLPFPPAPPRIGGTLRLERGDR